MLERDIEKHLVTKVKAAGGVAYKFTSPQRRSVPDRIVLLDAAAAARALRKVLAAWGVKGATNESLLEREATNIVAAMVHFVETKATGVKPTVGQLREHTRLRNLGFRVDVIDNKEDIDRRYKA